MGCSVENLEKVATSYVSLGAYGINPQMKCFLLIKKQFI